MGYTYLSQESEVNCRIGSLEIINYYSGDTPWVNCRIGSLEIT